MVTNTLSMCGEETGTVFPNGLSAIGKSGGGDQHLELTWKKPGDQGMKELKASQKTTHSLVALHAAEVVAGVLEVKRCKGGRNGSGRGARGGRNGTASRGQHLMEEDDIKSEQLKLLTYARFVECRRLIIRGYYKREYQEKLDEEAFQEAMEQQHMQEQMDKERERQNREEREWEERNDYYKPEQLDLIMIAGCDGQVTASDADVAASAQDKNKGKAIQEGTNSKSAATPRWKSTSLSKKNHKTRNHSDLCQE
ncbi:hypothetical protein Tco_0352088 [Tanacetum coccineum]